MSLRLSQVYRNKGVLKDAFFFNVVDKNEMVKGNPFNKVISLIRSFFSSIGTMILLINYPLMESFVWVFKNFSNQAIYFFNKGFNLLDKSNVQENQNYSDDSQQPEFNS